MELPTGFARAIQDLCRIAGSQTLCTKRVGGYDNLGGTRRLMREEMPNLKLDIDFDSMLPDQRREAADTGMRWP